MLLNILYGGIGSGKSSALYSLINENLKNNSDLRAVLIVPEQFSYTAEKALNDYFGGQGPNGIETTTFSRLISRYIKQENTLMPSGKTMLILKALSSIGENNMFAASAKRSGFVSSCQELFSEFKRYSIGPDDIAEIQSENATFTRKMSSIAEIYKLYSDCLPADFSDSDDAVLNFANYVKNTDLFTNTMFFIDDYSDFLPQHYALISTLVEKSSGVHITLGIGEDEDLFAHVEKAKSRLIAIGKSLNADVYTKKLTKKADYITSPEINHLLETWNNDTSYTEKCEDISIFSSRDPYSEVEHTASKIISLGRDKNMRFSDIGIVCGDEERYMHLIGAIFSDYNIPYFADHKLPVSMHPIAQTILSIFDILKENWSYSSVFAYLRNGYIYDKHGTPVNQEDIDILENYVFKYGIKGKKAWFSDFEKGGDTVFDQVIDSRNVEDFDLNYLNKLRKEIIAPFEKLLENKSRTGKKIAESLFEFLNDINLYQGILSECAEFDALGKRDESEQFRQVWNCIIEVLDQLAFTAGEDVMSRESFANYLKCGLSQCSISTIPSGLDRVSVGSVQKSSPTRVKALFILGTNHALIPLEPSSCGIITNSDRIIINQSLAEKDMEIAPDDIKRIQIENLKLYRTISAATQKLYISYPVADESGNSLMPSRFISEILGKFTQIVPCDNIIDSPDDSELLSSQKRGFYYMLNKLNEYYKDTPDTLWEDVYKWYLAHPEYNQRMEFLEAAAEYKKLKPKLSIEKAELLYGKNKKYSITALEKYSACPFAYYMSRGLYAKPQDTVEVRKSHLGSLIHYAVCEYCTAVENGAKTVPAIKENWEALTTEKSQKIIKDIMSSIRENVLPKSGEESTRLEYIISRCEKNLVESVENIRKSINGGDYAVIACEKDFEVKIDWKNDSVTLVGTIDRIDAMELGNHTNLRIVDYKSGVKKFSTTSILNKLDMQLVLYAQAAINMHEEGILDAVNKELSPKVTAVFYNKINEDLVSLDEDNPSLAKSELQKANKLDGLIVLEEQNDMLTLENIYDMDHSFEEKSKSDYLNVSLTKSGDLGSTSQIISRKNFNTVSDYLKKAVIDIDKSIKSGDISVNPYKKSSESACDFCDYKQICMFDADTDTPRKLSTNKKNVFELMEKEVAEDE